MPTQSSIDYKPRGSALRAELRSELNMVCPMLIEKIPEKYFGLFCLHFVLSKALSHDAICKETFIVNLLKKFYLLFSQFLKYAFYIT